MKKELEKKDKLSLSYLPSAFITASLPLRDIKSNVFTRKYNNISMVITGSSKVPYGSYGRLVLSLLTTHAVVDRKSENGTVEIYFDREKDFLNELQAPASRAEKFREQLQAFSTSSFLYQAKITKDFNKKEIFEDVETKDSKLKVSLYNSGNIPFIKNLQYMSVENEDVNADKKRRNFKIILSADFVNLCSEHSVPINYSTYSSIKNATGKDMYAWFVYRNNFLKENEPIFIPKEKFVEQFMPVKNMENYAVMLNTNFQYLKERISEIKQYYPELNVVVAKEGAGIILFKSPNQITESDKRYILITGGK